jgi:hypothetical protein
MIAYRHRSLIEHPDLCGYKSALAGPAICHQIADEWQVCGICDPLLWSVPEDSTVWHDLEDGWQVCESHPGTFPALLGKPVRWLRVVPVDDGQGRAWLAPVILTVDGARAYTVAYGGPDFLPQPTAPQAAAEAISREAREVILRQSREDNPDGVPQAVACRWVASLLALTHHVSVPTIAALGLVDDALVRAVLHAAAGLDKRLRG